MTREEATLVLDHARPQTAEIDRQFYDDEDLNAALDMGIEAIKKEPCEDARSLAQVFEILGNLMSIPYDLDRPINKDDVSESMDAIRALPPVTPTRKVGKWIITDKEHGRIWHCHCSNCKKDPQDCVGGTENWWLVRLPDYCPNCGAEMEGVEDEEN